VQHQLLAEARRTAALARERSAIVFRPELSADERR
jgi:hypothetical protein